MVLNIYSTIIMYVLISLQQALLTLGSILLSDGAIPEGSSSVPAQCGIKSERGTRHFYPSQSTFIQDICAPIVPLYMTLFCFVLLEGDSLPPLAQLPPARNPKCLQLTIQNIPGKSYEYPPDNNEDTLPRQIMRNQPSTTIALTLFILSPCLSSLIFSLKFRKLGGNNYDDTNLLWTCPKFF